MKKQEDKKNQDLVNEHNDYLKHILTYQKWYLFILLLAVLMTTSTLAIMQGKPLIHDGESYYNLYNAKTIDWQKFYYAPLYIFTLYLKEEQLIVLPIILAVSSLFFLFQLAKEINISRRFTLFFATLFILSPAFIHTFTTISAYSYLTFLALSGFTLLVQKKKWLQTLSIIPLALATFFDIFSSIILITLLSIYFYVSRKKKVNPFPLLLIGTTMFLILLNIFAFNQPFILGPFNTGQTITTLLSDFGSTGGVSVFLLMLALIGLTITWKKKSFYAAYLFLPVVIPAYLYNQKSIFFLSLLTTFFAVIGLIKLFEKKWTLDNLKKFTFFLLILGILFSTITYVERLQEQSPTKYEIEALQIIKEDTSKDVIVFSLPQKGPFIRYIAQRTPFYELHQQDTLKSDISRAIISSGYITQLFPLLEENNISIIYITKEMKESLPKDQGLLFLLKNERFILIHSNEEVEVWKYKKK